jgi:hypothetical protein
MRNEALLAGLATCARAMVRTGLGMAMAAAAARRDGLPYALDRPHGTTAMHVNSSRQLMRSLALTSPRPAWPRRACTPVARRTLTRLASQAIMTSAPAVSPRPSVAVFYPLLERYISTDLTDEGDQRHVTATLAVRRDPARQQVRILALTSPRPAWPRRACIPVARRLIAEHADDTSEIDFRHGTTPCTSPSRSPMRSLALTSPWPPWAWRACNPVARRRTKRHAS